MAELAFADAYCAKHGIRRPDFVQAVLPRTLHVHARLLLPLCRLFNPNYFAADVDLIRAAGELRRVRDLADEIVDFNHHPANSGLLRLTFKVRISTKRLRALMRATLPRSPDSAPPLAAKPDS